MSETVTPTTVPVEIVSRWNSAVSTRRSSPRSTVVEARAKLVHTSHGGRQVVVYVTKPLMERLGWCVGGSIKTVWTVTEEALCLLLNPSHIGPRARISSPKTTTCCISISGDFIAQSACDPVRAVTHEARGDALYLELPRGWAAIAIRDNIRASIGK